MIENIISAYLSEGKDKPILCLGNNAILLSNILSHALTTTSIHTNKRLNQDYYLIDSTNFDFELYATNFIKSYRENEYFQYKN